MVGGEIPLPFLMLYQTSLSKNELKKASDTIKAICEVFDVKPSDLLAKRKLNGYSSKDEYVCSYARAAAMTFLSKLMRQADVATLMNCTTISTVAIAKKRLNVLIETNPFVKEKVIEIFKKLKQINNDKNRGD